MNSFNHYSFGSVAQWLYEYVGGIRLDPERPGYEHVVIAPTLGPLRQAEVAFRSVRGEIRSAWHRTDSGIALSVVVPANVTATVVLPGVGEPTEGGGQQPTPHAGSAVCAAKTARGWPRSARDRTTSSCRHQSESRLARARVRSSDAVRGDSS